MVVLVKKANPSLTVFLLFAFLACLFVFKQYYDSVYFSPRERITIAVYNYPAPFVFSYSKTSGLASVIYFDPKIYAYVPGGYQWYKLNSVNALGYIEKKPSQLIRQTMENLIGAPVDLVIYPPNSTSPNKDVSPASFTDFFTSLKTNGITKGQFLSTSNLLDKMALNKIFKTRMNQITFFNLTDDYNLDEKNTQKRYLSSRLDLLLRGLFYQDLLLTKKNKVIVYSLRKNYQAAVRVARIIEGTGIKVLSAELTERPKDNCVIYTNPKDRLVALVLASYFHCPVKNQTKNDWQVDFYLDDNLGKIYQ